MTATGFTCAVINTSRNRGAGHILALTHFFHDIIHQFSGRHFQPFGNLNKTTQADLNLSRLNLANVRAIKPAFTLQIDQPQAQGQAFFPDDLSKNHLKRAFLRCFR